MDERLKEVRKAVGLNQTEFGSRIGVKQGTVAGYETGARTPIDAVIQAVCREFNVNEVWLRTGVGNMFAARTREDEIMDFAGSLINYGSDDFRVRFVSALAKLDERSWAVLAQIARDMVAENKTDTEEASD